MEIKAIDHNVNIIAMQKNGKNYGMCCAWCTQAGADKLICCVGGVDYSVDDGAILISGARAEVKCQVIDILHLSGIEAENVLYLQMLSGKENGGDALHIADLPM